MKTEHRWINRICIDLEDEGCLRIKYCVHCDARKYFILPANSPPDAEYKLLGELYT